MNMIDGQNKHSQPTIYATLMLMLRCSAIRMVVVATMKTIMEIIRTLIVQQTVASIVLVLIPSAAVFLIFEISN